MERNLPVVWIASATMIVLLAFVYRSAIAWDPLVLSLQIASLAMLLSLVFGTALALLLHWRRLPARYLTDAIISSPLVLPPTVMGYYLLVALGPDSWFGQAYHAVFGKTIVFTFAGAVVAATVGSLPLVIRSVRLGLESVEPNLIAAARTLGAGPARILVTVTLPLAAPGLIAGAMLGFARALGDYGMTQMVAGARVDGIGLPSTSPSAIYVYDQILVNNEDGARTMALATTVVGVALLYVANRLTRKLHHHG
jgi:molybdate transport system permease protein